MKKRFFLVLAMVISVFMTSCGTEIVSEGTAVIGQNGFYSGTIRLSDNGALLTNPGMGWNFCYYSNQIYEFWNTLKPNDYLDDYPCDIVYFRIGWNWIEPEEGKFNWDFTDKFAKEWWERGKRSAYRWVVCYPGDQSTPLWVRDAGAQGVEYNPIIDCRNYGFNYTLADFPQDAKEWMLNSNPNRPDYDPNFNGGVPVVNGDVENYRKTWVPKYDDPIFLEKWENFLAAAAERYDGNPNIEFIDIGSIGSWGEGHPHMSAPAEIQTSMGVKHFDLFKKYFKSTRIMAPDDLIKTRESLLDLAVEYGFGVYDDSVVEGNLINKDVTDQFWRTAPTDFEYGPYDWPSEAAYKSVDLGHVSYARIHNDPYESKKKIWADEITLRLGYRLTFTELVYKDFKPGKQAKITFKLKNMGAAPNYIGGSPAITIIDSKGNIAVHGISGFDIKTLMPANTIESARSMNAVNAELTLEIPSDLASGDYKVFLSVDYDGAPYYKLPLSNGINKRYEIATLKV